MFRKLNKKSSGFTLIELLVVVLILSILMAIALPLYLNAVANSETKTCRTNMQTIANAVQANHVAVRPTPAYPAAGTVVILAIAPDLQTVPSCPNGGQYTIETGTGGAPFNVKCSGNNSQGVAHGSFQAFVDTQ